MPFGSSNKSDGRVCEPLTPAQLALRSPVIVGFAQALQEPSAPLTSVSPIKISAQEGAINGGLKP